MAEPIGVLHPTVPSAIIIREDPMHFARGIRRWRRTSIVVLPLVWALLAACADRDGEDTDDSDSGVDRATPAGAVADSTTVPPAVEALGHHGENAYDFAKTGAWANADASVDSLRTALAPLATTATAEEIAQVRESFGALERAVTARQSRVASAAANHLTELGARVSMRFGPRVPADVTLLDYYGREIEIAAGASDLARMRQVRDSISVVWRRLEEHVEERGGAGEADRFAKLVQQVSQARTVAGFLALAKPILDEVDKLEAVFKR